MDFNWIPIDKELPEIDEFVLFLFENGYPFWDHLDKDYGKSELDRFFKGSEYTGPVVAWARLPDFKHGELNAKTS